MFDISIIIVNWNTKELLLNCIKSLLQETSHCTMEIIVVDNASTDGSPKAVKKMYPNVNVIINKSNLGFSKANNIGINQSNGRYLCLVNSDIKILDGCVDRMCCYMEKHDSIGVLGPKTLNADMSLRINCRTFPTLWNSFCQAIGLHKFFPRYRLFSDSLMTYFLHDSIKGVNVLPGCFLMIRKEAIDEVGFLDEKFFFYGEDKDWCKRMKDGGWDVVFFPNSEVIHYAGKSAGKTPVRFLIEGLRSNSYYWEKHHGRFKKKLFLGVMLLSHSIRLGSSLIMYVAIPAERKQFSERLSGSIACTRWLINAIFCK